MSTTQDMTFDITSFDKTHIHLREWRNEDAPDLAVAISNNSQDGN
jgi:hypothetical protein